MRTLFFTLAFVLFCFDDYSQNTDYSLLEVKKYPQGNWLTYKKGETQPYTGTAEKKYCNKKISNVYYYKGLKNSEYIYVNEKYEKSCRWDTVGNLINESYYNGDSSFVKVNSWYINGQKKSEAILINGQMDSTFTVWYENGIIKEIIHYKNGLWNGTWTNYDINGNIISQGEYKNDELIKGDPMCMIVEF